MAVSRRLRFEILRRDGHTCRYCGAKAPDAVLTVDHVIPVALGGTDDPTNLVTACDDCNGGKTSIAPGSPLVADVAADALRWRRAIEQAQFELETEHEILASIHEQFQAEWLRWTHPVSRHVHHEPEPTGNPLCDNWRLAGTHAMGHSTPVSLIDGVLFVQIEYGWAREVRAGVARDEIFRYFCGCCWREVTNLQESARRILESEDG